ncbi:hypothetical protein JCM8547_001000 [Rhodosporidiobolus lusitaniae]
MTSTLPPLAQATSASVGAVVSNVLVFPLDTLVSRLQTSSSSSRRPSSSGGYSSIAKAVRTILEQSGVKGFYAGLGPDSLSTLISQFVYFFFFSALRERFVQRQLRGGQGEKVALSSSSSSSSSSSRPPPPVLSAIEELAIGCLAGIVAKGLVSPLSMITVRAQTSSEQKGDAVGGKKGDLKPVDEKAVDVKAGNGGLKAGESDDESEDGTYKEAPSAVRIAREIYEEQGIGGFWSGFQSTVFLTTNPAITYYVFAALQRAFIPAKHRLHPKPYQTFLCGALASATASAVTYPLILAKTRLQFRSPTGRALYSSMLDVFRKLYARHGMAGLYTGIAAQLIKSTFSEGIKLLVKDRIELLIILAHRILTRQRSHTVQTTSS